MSWYWLDLTPYLKAQGYKVSALTLTGLGDRITEAKIVVGPSMLISDIFHSLNTKALLLEFRLCIVKVGCLSRVWPFLSSLKYLR